MIPTLNERFHVQNVEDDDEYSSSEGSTVDCPLGGERGESVDFELDKAMEPDACFFDGEDYSHWHN